MKNTIALYLIALGVVIIALQNAGIIPPIKVAHPQMVGPIEVTGTVDVGNTVTVDGSVDIDKINSPVDVNGPVEVEGSVGIDGSVTADLSSVAGYDLVRSVDGMNIGVASVSNTLIPINWGEMSMDLASVAGNRLSSIAGYYPDMSHPGIFIGVTKSTNLFPIRWGGMDVENTIDVSGSVDVNNAVELDQPVEVTIKRPPFGSP
ncbi:MAG: hypothetical protein ACLQU4_20875 [Limisphaerales bacterium]